MKEGKQSSPKLLKKSQIFSSTSNLQNPSKLHLPSRYAHQKVAEKNELVNILSSIETNVKSSEVDKIKHPASPSRIKNKDRIVEVQRKKESSQFKPRPLKRYTEVQRREESDLEHFKNIFIQPIKQNLDNIQLRDNKSSNSKKITSEYEKLLQFENGTKTRTDPNEDQELKENEIKAHYEDAILLLKSESFAKTEEEDFYEEQIRIEPPDFPNSSMASTLSPGSGYAPSIPLTSNITKQGNLHELLIRAKAGMNTEDIEKEAHLSFYLGMVYEQQRNHASALKFYRRYLGFAKGMEDKIGMALGANRVGTNYFYNQDYKKSIVFHNENLKLSDNENCFAGFYNLGICHRRIGMYDEAVEYFETALQWAGQNGEAESECITYGQLAMTYKYMELYQKALENFQSSLTYCDRLKKTKLQLSNLMNILLISSQNNIYSEDRILELTESAYECAKLLGDKKFIEVFSLNLGIIRGKTQFQEFEPTVSEQFAEDIEQILQ